MPKSKELDFLDTLPNSENDFLANLPDATPATTPTGLPELSASATPSIDHAQSQIAVNPDLLNTLQSGSATQMETPVPQNGYQSPPAPQSGPIDKTQLGLDSAEAALTAGGMGVGALAATALAPATGGASILIPAIGAAIGYATGKSASDLLQRAIGKKAPLNNLPDALVETAQNVKEGAQMEMFGQISGKAIIGPVQKVLAPLAGKAGELTVSAIETTINKAKQYGIDLTPAEVTQSKGLQLLENFLSNVPFSAGRIQDFRANQLEELVKRRENLIENSGGERSLEEIGLKIRNLVDDSVKDYNNFSEENLARLKDRVLAKVGSQETYHDLIQPLQNINEKNIGRLRDVKNKLYDNAKDLMPDDLTIAPTNLIQEATTFKNELSKATIPVDKEALSIASSLSNSNTPMNADTLIANRKALSDLAAKNTNFATGVMNNSARVYRRMIDAIDKDMTTMAESTGNQTIIDAQRIANKANVDYKNYVEDPLVERIAKGKKPDAIVGAVYSPGNDTEIQKFQKFYGPEFADKAKKVFTTNFLGLTADPSIPDKPLTGSFIRNQMQRYGTTLNTIYSPAEVNYFRRVADVLDGKTDAVNEVIKNPLLRSIISSPRASGIIDLIVKPRDVGGAAVIKKYVGDQGVKEIQNGLLNKLLVKNQIGTFSPQTFAREFDKYEPRVLQQVLPPDVYRDLRGLADVSIRAGGAERLAGNPSGTSRNLLIPVGIGFMLHNPVTTGTLIIGSRAFTELYLSSAGRQWLTKGFTLPAISNEAATVASKITLLLLNQQKKHDENQLRGQ